MDPTIWGPKLWFVIHTVTFNYPSNPTNIDKKVHFDFFMNLRLNFFGYFNLLSAMIRYILPVSKYNKL